MPESRVTLKPSPAPKTPPRRRWPWWHEQTTAFRRIVRTALAVLGTGLAAVAFGVITASFTGSLGPHVAQYSTTLNSEITVDMGPLGALIVDSRLPLGLGVDVLVREIPDELVTGGVNPVAGLTADLSSYAQFLTNPEAAIRDATNGLLLDTLGRTVLAWSILIVAIALGRLVSRGVLRQAVRHAWRQPLVPVVAAGLVAALVVPIGLAMTQGSSGVGRTSVVLAGTPLEGARVTGRLGSLVDYYGGYVVDAIRDNETFYADVEANLHAAYAADPEPLTPQGVPPMAATLDPEPETTEPETNGPETNVTEPTAPVTGEPETDTSQTSEPQTGEPPTDAAAGNQPGANPAATSEPTGELEVTQESTEVNEAAQATPSGEETEAEEAQEPDPVTMVVVADMHCNIGMAPVVGAVVELSEADLVLNAGDTVMAGTSVESVCINAFADGIPGGVPVVVSDGNHDSETTASQEEARGWTVLRGEPVEVAGVTVLGDRDPTLSSLGAPTHNQRDETFGAMGDRLAELACERQGTTNAVDILLVHNMVSTNAALDAGCVPLSISGHLHRRIGPWQRGFGVQYVGASTAGAAKDKPTIGPLQNTAAITVLRWDRANDIPLDFRILTFNVDRTVTIGPWQSFPPGSEEPVELAVPVPGAGPWDQEWE